jgi:hypothetical protein
VSATCPNLLCSAFFSCNALPMMAVLETISIPANTMP